MATVNTSTIQQMYVAYFNRPADVSGLANWEAFAAGKSLAQLKTAISTEFAKSAEYTIVFTGMTTSQIVTKVYNNLLNRDPDAPGLQNWINHLADGSSTISSLVTDIVRDAGAGDVDTIANKVLAAQAFTGALDTVAEINGYSGAAANAVAAAWLSTVGATAASLTAATTTAALTTVTANVVSNSGANIGTTFTLTTGADNIVGTANNDVINATGTSLTAADNINGGAGTDTLSLTVTAAATDATFGAMLTGIEVINIRNTAATGNVAAINASTLPGLTAVNLNQGSGDVTVTNLASGTSAGVIGNGTTITGALNAGYAGTATAATVNIAGGTVATSGAITVSGTGLTSTTVNSTGAANTVGALTLAATTTTLNVAAATNLTTGAVTNTGGVGGLTTVNVSGAGTVNLSATALESTVTKIDASANTGGLTVTLGSAVTQTVTGGSGKDVITTGAVLTTGSVNAGDGVDTLVLGAVTDANTASLAAKYTNFETLRVNGTFDASLIAGITAVELSGAVNAITKLNATQAAAVTARVDIGATTLTLATATGTSDVLNLTLGTGTTTAAAANTGALTVTGFETLNLTTAAGPTATAGANRTSTITGAIVDTSLTAINLKGTAFTFTDIATTKAVTIDGSALTGDGAATAVGLTVGGSATAGSTITGSAVKDVFVIGAEGSTYNGGAGNDTFTTTAAILAADGTTDVVLAGGTGTDTLTLTGALTLTDNNFTNVTGMERLSTAATTAVSYTGFGAAAKTAFADGITITSGTLVDGATYTVGAGLYDKAVTLTLVSAGDGASTADNIAITTGSAADTVTVTAANWIGAAGAAGALTVNTGAGNDTISVTTGTILAVTGAAPVTITGGTGADTITAVGVNAATGLTVTFVVAAGDSLVTAYDSITGFDIGTGALLSSTLDFTAVNLAAYGATAATGFTSTELTVAVSAAGVVTFAGSSAASVTFAQKLAAVQSVVVANNGDTALFTDNGNTYVFNNSTVADSLVELVGVTGTSLVTINATAAGAIFIA